MWFSSARKTPRIPLARGSRQSFRPCLEALEDRRLMSAGALDTTFGGSLVGSNSPAGTVLGPSGVILSNPSNAMVVYPNTGSNPSTDGKILVGGSIAVTTTTNKGTTTTRHFALVRYNVDGSLDSTFGTQGIVSTAIGKSADIWGLALQSDGKVLAVGEENDGTYLAGAYNNFVLARYTSAGQLDSSFGASGSGFVLTRAVLAGGTSGPERATAVVIEGQGSSAQIYVCGLTQFTTGTRKNAQSGYDMALVRYTANGSLDTTFAGSGIAITPNMSNGTIAPDNSPYALAIQSDGKIVMAGATGSEVGAMAAVRYTTTGALDSSFGSGGVVTLTANSTEAGAFGVLVQSNGAIVLSGYSHVGGVEKQTLARVSSSDALDTTFGNSGYVVNLNMLNGHNIVQAGNGDLLTAGTVGTKNFDVSDDFGVAAFLSNGAPDTSFGPNGTGTSTAAITNVEDMGEMLALQSDGKIVVDGFSAANSVNNVALARFLPPDTKIGSFTGSSAAGNVTLTAANILNSNPTSTISQVNFYLQNPDLSLTLLGTGTNNNGTWTFTFAEATDGLTSGNTYTFVAQAVDSNGLLSDPVSVSLMVM